MIDFAAYSLTQEDVTDDRIGRHKARPRRDPLAIDSFRLGVGNSQRRITRKLAHVVGRSLLSAFPGSALFMVYLNLIPQISTEGGNHG